MISSEVQRTLVKSPPELWAEISDPEALARQLGEFGEIRITRAEPERRVEWEAGDTSGTVVIKPSGWGTKVKLTVERAIAPSEADAAPAGPGVEAAGAAPALAQPFAARADEPGETARQDAVPGEIEAESESQPPPQTSAPSPIDRPATHAGFALGTPPAPGDAADAPADATSEPEAEEAPDGERAVDAEQDAALAANAGVDAGPQLEPRRGFFARLFGRRRQAPPAASDLPSQQEDEPTAARELEPAADSEPPLAPSPEGQTPAAEPYDALATWVPELSEEGESHLEASGGEAAQDDAADARTAEEIAAEHLTTVLTGVLDRLGAAHHRPFSRA